jgi:hypothetical protein
MAVRHFSINTPTTTAAAESDDQRLYRRTRNGAKSVCPTRSKHQAFVVCCHMLAGSWAGRVSDQAETKDRYTQSTAKEKEKVSCCVYAEMTWSSVVNQRQ